jgi:hypothetical protein
MSRAWVAALVLWPALAAAHGGLPVSEGVLRQGTGDTMYIPVAFWGVWIGDGVGPWTWICEEEINPNRARKFALSTDGTFYTNDVRGVTLSNDHGCTWTPATGALSLLRTTDVAAHPSDGATAWVSTDDVSEDADGGQIVANAVFVTHDHGATFAPLPGLPAMGLRYQSVKAAPSNGDILYVTSATAMTPFNVTVQRSSDGGLSFDPRPLNFTVDGAIPYGLEVMAIDPRDPDGIYLRAFVTAPDPDLGSVPLHVLLRSSDGGMTVTEVARTVGEMTPSGATHGIDGAAIDAGRGRVYVATKSGLLAGDDPGGAVTVNLQPTSSLTQAQCVEVHGSSVYACSSNYAPDFAALAKSDDGAQSFKPVLSYQQTQGPMNCPADTPVGSMCPYYWLTYSAQLGINMGIDGGSSDGGAGGQGGGCSCELTGGGAALGAPLLVLIVSGLLLRRRLPPPRRGGA